MDQYSGDTRPSFRNRTRSMGARLASTDMRWLLVSGSLTLLVAGAIGWTYAGLLGLALVYLGEHYAADLVAGAALAEVVRTQAPRSRPAVGLLGRALGSLQRLSGVG